MPDHDKLKRCESVSRAMLVALHRENAPIDITLEATLVDLAMATKIQLFNA